MPTSIHEELVEVSIEDKLVTQLVEEDTFNVQLTEEVLAFSDQEDVFNVEITEDLFREVFTETERIVLEPDDVIYTKRVDFINDNLLYRGEAVPGTLESAPVWRMRRITIGADNDVTEEFADGDSNFDNIWDDRLGLTYL